MLRGKSLQKRHLPMTLSASCFSFFLTIDFMEGCAPCPVRGTKNDDLALAVAGDDVPAVEPLPLPYLNTCFTAIQ
jgi:hypothetical protein